MIDLVYKTVQTIVNKENNGYIKPTEFNTLANLVQIQIFEGYFSDNNRDKNRENKGLTNKGYSNLDFNQKQKIVQFSDSAEISKNVSGLFDLPENLYLIEDDGVISDKMRVIEEVTKSKVGYISNSMANDPIYPTYTQTGKTLKVNPNTVNTIQVHYLRKPKMPLWTYNMIGNKELFNPANSSYQDFELHESEFEKIVMGILLHSSIILRETEITKIADAIREKITYKENN